MIILNFYFCKTEFINLVLKKFLQPMRISTTLSLLFFFSTLIAQPVLVKDIKPGLSSGIYLGSAQSALVGNTLYFTAINNTNGEELWKSDGTEAGTVLVRDIYPGSQFSGPQEFYGVYLGQLYFTALDTIYGTEVWHTDDGSEGAVLLYDACSGDCSGAEFAQYAPAAEYDGKLFLNMGGSSAGELWVSDGKTAGTMLLKDINPGFSASRPRNPTVFKDKLYFSADSANASNELWMSDGTAVGTTMVKNINSANFGSADIRELVAGEDVLYFWAYESSATGREIWKSDGTETGTVMVKDIKPGSGNGAPDYESLSNSIWLDNKLLFFAQDDIAGPELWLTDGTEAGTFLVKDINPGTASSNIQFLAILDGKAFFRANDGINGNELWSTDGTEAGTQLVKNINPGAQDGLHFSTVHFIVFQNKMLFTANDNTTGREIWLTDGTETGTQLFLDINAGAQESAPSNYHLIDNTLFVFAQTQPTGRELWKYDLSTIAANEPQLELKIQVYPTTSKYGLFNLVIETDAPESFRIEALDMLGRVQFSQTMASQTQTFNLSTLPSGAYFIRIITENGQQSAVQPVFIAK